MNMYNSVPQYVYNNNHNNNHNLTQNQVHMTSHHEPDYDTNHSNLHYNSCSNQYNNNHHCNHHTEIDNCYSCNQSTSSLSNCNNNHYYNHSSSVHGVHDVHIHPSNLNQFQTNTFTACSHSHSHSSSSLPSIPNNQHHRDCCHHHQQYSNPYPPPQSVLNTTMNQQSISNNNNSMNMTQNANNMTNGTNCGQSLFQNGMSQNMTSHRTTTQPQDNFTAMQQYTNNGANSLNLHNESSTDSSTYYSNGNNFHHSQQQQQRIQLTPYNSLDSNSASTHSPNSSPRTNSAYQYQNNSSIILSCSSSTKMRILFIHGGKECYPQPMGNHYEQLIKHSMHLLPMDQYRKLRTMDEKNQYRAIESLPRGCLLGVALIDESFWFTSKHLQNPWAHGPYCYHILDALRFDDDPIECRGLPGIWKIHSNIIKQIKSMSNISKKLNEWLTKYDISNASNIYQGLTIKQPFAEAIIRRLKNIENRSSRLFRITPPEKDGKFEGCRVCINTRMKTDNLSMENIDYIEYGKPYLNQLGFHGHYKLSQKVVISTKNRYKCNVSLIHCQCLKDKLQVLNKKNISNKVQSVHVLPQKKKKKISHKHPVFQPLPNYNNCSKRRKPSRRRVNKLPISMTKGRQFAAKDVEDINEQKENHGVMVSRQRWHDKLPDPQQRQSQYENQVRLQNMGYSFDAALLASNKCESVDEALEYLYKLQCVKDTNNKGYSDKLKHLRKEDRKRTFSSLDPSEDDIKDNHIKKRKIGKI